MKKEDHVRLRCMLDAAREAVLFTKRKTRGDLDTDRVLTLALTRCFEIVGEAAANVSDECKAAQVEIPWNAIIRMRGRLLRVLGDVNPASVWNTVIEDLPPLIAALKSVVPPEDKDTASPS